MVLSKRIADRSSSVKMMGIKQNNNKKESTKGKMLGAELFHPYTCTHCILYSMQAPFALTTIHLVLTLVGNGRQLNLPRGNFIDCKWPPWAVGK